MNNRKSPLPDHVPGNVDEAAARAYFDRGSLQAIEKNHWRAGAFGSLFVAILAIISTVTLGLKSNVEVFQVAKTESGVLQVVQSASKFTPDEETQMAWTSRWLAELTEISPALWQRNIATVQSKVVGTASDQVRSYLEKLSNNPPVILAGKPTYIREYERRSVNKVGEKTYLVRYDLISRPAPGVQVERMTYAATVTLVSIGHKSRDDVFNNPEGLAVSSFSISEESAPR